MWFVKITSHEHVEGFYFHTQYEFSICIKQGDHQYKMSNEYVLSLFFLVSIYLANDSE